MAELDLAAALDETVRAARKVMLEPPSVGVVLGTGLGSFVSRMRNVVTAPFAELPHLAPPRTEGNEGLVCFGRVDDVPIVCLQGRAHLYEGSAPWRVVHGVRLMARLGVRAVLLTDACGALDASWAPGTMMLVRDHLDVAASAASFLPFGDEHLFRAPSALTTPYDAPLADELADALHRESLLASRIGQPFDVDMREGTYANVRGPGVTEAEAEARMLATLGANAVGTALVPEVSALAQMGVRTAALAYVSWAAGVAGSGSAATATLPYFERLLRAWVLRAHRLDR